MNAIAEARIVAASTQGRDASAQGTAPAAAGGPRAPRAPAAGAAHPPAQPVPEAGFEVAVGSSTAAPFPQPGITPSPRR